MKKRQLTTKAICNGGVRCKFVVLVFKQRSVSWDGDALLNALHCLCTNICCHAMRNFQPIFIFLLILAQSCALLDGYKDNQHSWYAKELTSNEKLRIGQGQTLTRSFDTPRKIGQLKITKGNRKFGRYNFIEIGDWKEYYQFSSPTLGKGESYEETTYDNFGNILNKKVIQKLRGDIDFYTSDIWSSEIQIFDTDTVLIQKLVGFHNNSKLAGETTLAVLNYKELLSDRLKTKIKVGTETRYDRSGKLIRSTNYKFQDKVKR